MTAERKLAGLLMQKISHRGYLKYYENLTYT
jgi:hypothetical protein